jgi:hypothetical protein
VERGGGRRCSGTDRPRVSAARWWAGGSLILAYHAVPDPAVFRRHAEHLAEHRVVLETEVGYAVRSGTELPRAVSSSPSMMVTPPSSTSHSPSLDELGLTATAYVAPG